MSEITKNYEELKSAVEAKEAGKTATEYLIQQDKSDEFREDLFEDKLKQAGIEPHEIEGLSQTERADLYERANAGFRYKLNDMKDRLNGMTSKIVDQELDKLDDITTDINLKESFNNAHNNVLLEPDSSVKPVQQPSHIPVNNI